VGKNQRIEPGRKFAQRDCVLEPGFDRPDNLTFFDSGPEYVTHRPSDVCPIDGMPPHLYVECGWYEQPAEDEGEAEGNRGDAGVV
jgi:hypothetical protein